MNQKCCFPKSDKKLKFFSLIVSYVISWPWTHVIWVHVGGARRPELIFDSSQALPNWSVKKFNRLGKISTFFASPRLVLSIFKPNLNFNTSKVEFLNDRKTIEKVGDWDFKLIKFWVRITMNIYSPIGVLNRQDSKSTHFSNSAEILKI